MRRTFATLTTAALIGGAGLATAEPARAAVIDPSAYGIASSGAIALPAQPSVDWTSGAAVSSSSPGLRDGPVSVGTMAVAAGSGFAAAHIADLRYGDLLSITSLTAACAGGRTAVSVAGTARGAQLHPGMRITLPGGYAEIGATTTHPDGTVTVTGLTLAVDGEVLLAAVTRC